MQVETYDLPFENTLRYYVLWIQCQSQQSSILLCVEHISLCAYQSAGPITEVKAEWNAAAGVWEVEHI